MSFEQVYSIALALSRYILMSMVPVFFMLLLLWLGFRAHKSREAVGTGVSHRRPLMMHSSLNISVAFVWMLIYGERHINHESSWFHLFDVGAPLGVLGLLFVIPAGLIASWYIGINGPLSAAKKKAYSYILTSRVFYAISAVYPFWMVLFYTGMLWSE